MKPDKQLLLAVVAALGVAFAIASNDTMAETKGFAAKKPAGEATAKGHEKEIQIESWSWGNTQPAKTGGQNQTQGSAPQKKPGSPMPSESMSLNYGQVKPAAPSKPNQVGTEQPKKPVGMLLPAVQKVRDAAATTKQDEKKELKK